MASSNITGTTALVTGASRGFGRATAVALHDAGADVVAVARDAELLSTLRDDLGDALTIVVADVTDPSWPGRSSSSTGRRRSSSTPEPHR